MIRPLVGITAAYIAGIALGRLGLANLFWAGAAGGILAAFPFGLALFRRIPWFLAVLLTVVAVSGAAAFIFTAAPAPGGILDYAGSFVTVEGTIVEEPLHLSEHSAYRLRVETVETKDQRIAQTGALLVKIYGAREEHYWFGERLRLRAYIIEPRERRNPGGFDYRFHLRSRGIDALAYPGAHQVSSLGPGRPGPFAAPVMRLRARMVEGITANLPSPSAELLSAILFGRRLHLPREIQDNFTRSGAGHLMAVSGLHVGLVAALILSIWRRLGLKGGLPLAVAIVLIFAYAYLTGLRPSAVRAALMLSLALGALLLDRERDTPTALAAAALITLAVNPLFLFTLSFQLSYAATLAIIYLTPPLLAILVRMRLPAYLRSLTAVTLAAQLGVLPLGCYHFAHLPLAALFFNLLLIPLMAPLVGFGLGGAVLYTVSPPLAAPLLWACRPLLEWTLFLTSLARFPGIYLPVYPPSLFDLALIYGLAAAFLFLYYRLKSSRMSPADHPPAILTAGQANAWRGYLSALTLLLKQLMPNLSLRPALLPAAALLLALILVWSGIIFPSVPELMVTFIDVGQGAAVLVQAPCGANILIDGGGTPSFRGYPGEVGERILLPFLRYQNIRRLDLVIISNPSEDHFGGLLPLLGAIPVSRLLVPPLEVNSSYYLKLLARAEELLIPVDLGYDGRLWSTAADPRLKLEILHPPHTLLRTSGSMINNNSQVIRLHFGQIHILFTGDIEQEAVQNLLRRRKGSLQADILQVPHHGGKLPNLPDLLRAVNPCAAVIPVGVNSYGHPHPDLLSDLKKAEVPVYRTDLHGAVILKTDGNQIKIRTMSEDSGKTAGTVLLSGTD
ncbi:MAG: DNA internalization-related competence protein ComEC/Rec2, partial [Dethiobacter sp.]|nr:DNA internalization-related competence protein ComEC/Rec2 [Dethiobacter sp.]